VVTVGVGGSLVGGWVVAGATDDGAGIVVGTVVGGGVLVDDEVDDEVDVEVVVGASSPPTTPLPMTSATAATTRPPTTAASFRHDRRAASARGKPESLQGASVDTPTRAPSSTRSRRLIGTVTAGAAPASPCRRTTGTRRARSSQVLHPST
jgi:hypothetical protein